MPVKKEEEEDEAGQARVGREPTDFRLTSARAWTEGRRFNVLKFGTAGRTIDLRHWRRPVKLNRRSEVALRTLGDDATAEGSRMAVDGRQEEEAAAAKRRFFQRKTTRIMHSEESDETTRMRREERHPFLLEDATPVTRSHAQRWTGRLEGAVATGSTSTPSSHYIFLVLDKDQNDFKVIPAHRTYTFTKRPNRTVLDAEQADEEFQRRHRNFWSMHSRDASAAASSSANGRVKLETPDVDGTQRLLGRAAKKEHDRTALQKKGERTMKAVHRRDVVGDVDDRKPKAKLEEDDQVFDEFDYESDVQDDEEGAGMEVDEANDAEDNRMAEEKRKREMRAANRSASEGVESDTEARPELDSAGRRAKKLMRRQGRAEYDSDEDPDERNPYAPDAESSSDDEAPPSAKSTASQRRPPPKPSRHDGRNGSRGTPSARPSVPSSRGVSPSPSGNAGSAAVARRATSPRTHSPRASLAGPSKRKAEDASASGAKRARTATPVGNGEIADADLIDYLRRQPDVTAQLKDLAKYVKKVLGVDIAARQEDLQAALSRVALKQGNGQVRLRPELA